MIRTTFIASLLVLVTGLVHAQPERISQRADGSPDISGIWQSLNNANWNLEAQVAEQGPVEITGCHWRCSARSKCCGRPDDSLSSGRTGATSA